jgi:hypothetical protein
LISTIHGKPLDTISYLIRIISFCILFQLSYQQTKNNKDHWEKIISLYLTTSLLIYILEIALDQLTSRVAFLNGAYRHSASIGSPIGLASTLSVIVAGHLMLWIKKKNLSYALLSSLGILSILSTATRSVALTSLFLFWLAALFRFKSWSRILTFFAFPLSIILIATIIPEGSGITDRITSTTANNQLDNSSEFRILILDSYFRNISPLNLIFGLGLGSFPTWFQENTGLSNVAPHFEWLWILSEFGIISLIIYTTLILTLCLKLLNKKEIDPHVKFIGIFILTSHQTIYQLSNPMYFYQAYTSFALLAGLYTGLLKNQSRIDKPRAST